MKYAIDVPEQTTDNENTHVVFMTTQKAEVFVSSDQTGMMPQTSNRGMKYVCIFYIYNTNFIKVVTIKSKNKEELLRAYKELYAYFERRGFKPKIQKMDNETSK